MRSVITALSVLCVLAASPPYIIDTVRGRTRPERVTWAIFAVLGVVAVVSQLAAGATWSVVFTIVDGLAGVVVLVLSFWFGVGGWSLQDRLALAVAAVGVALALAERDPLFSILGVIVADASGMALTWRKAFLDPGSETSVAWLLSGLGGFLAVMVVNQVTLDQVMYPLYLGVANCGVLVSQYYGKRYNKVKLEAKGARS